MNSFKNKKGQLLQIVLLLMMGVAYYIFSSREWISIQDDSVYYLQPTGHEGVMPIYPLFIFVMKLIFGEGLYLTAVVLAQSILAIICTLIFTLYLQNAFQLRKWEGVLLYIACMLPYSIYLPESGITHQILTEGLAYSLFYIYFIFVLQYIFTKKHKFSIVLIVVAVIMSLIRSQLLFLLVVNLLAFLTVQFINKKNKKRLIQLGNIVISAFGGIAVMFLLILLIYQINGYYLTKQMPVIKNWDNPNQEMQKESVTQESLSKKEHKKSVSLSQFTTILMIRGFYEADEEDVNLFDTPEMQEIFKRVYKAVDEKKYRYVYARQDLYMWKDLICDRITTEAYSVINEYLDENPNINLDPRIIVRELGLKVLLHHFDRYLYHTMRMMIPGFISSIFFQIEPIYLICHFITLFLYLFAVIGGIFCIKKRRNRMAGEFILTTVAFLIVMVTIVNVVFFGLQRYMVYAMGIFYCGIYVTTKEILVMQIEKYPNNRYCKILKKIF